MITHTVSVTPLRIYHTRCAQRSSKQGKKQHASLSLSLSPSLSPFFFPSLSLLYIPSSFFFLFYPHLCTRLSLTSSFYIVIFPGVPLIIGSATPWTSTALYSGSMADSTFSTLLSQRERFRNSSPTRSSTTGMILDSSRWRHLDEGGFLLRLLITSVQRYRIAGKFGGELNLAVWQSMLQPPNLNPPKFPTRIHV